MIEHSPEQINVDESQATWGEDLVDSLPIVTGSLPVAFAFGLNAARPGFTSREAIFFSCAIYAGASQVVIAALLSVGSSLWLTAFIPPSKQKQPQ